MSAKSESMGLLDSFGLLEDIDDAVKEAAEDESLRLTPKKDRPLCARCKARSIPGSSLCWKHSTPEEQEAYQGAKEAKRARKEEARRRAEERRSLQTNPMDWAAKTWLTPDRYERWKAGEATIRELLAEQEAEEEASN